jgi:hypothetical protein
VRETPLELAMLYAGPDEAGYDAGGLSLEEIAQFADGVGAYKAVLINPDGTQAPGIWSARTRWAWTSMSGLFATTARRSPEKRSRMSCSALYTAWAWTASSPITQRRR